MRLRIHYSVEESELLNEVHNLFGKAHDKFNSAKDLCIRQMVHGTVLRETGKLIASIETFEEAVKHFSLSLSEIKGILQGFEIYENSSKEDPVENVPNEEG